MIIEDVEEIDDSMSFSSEYTFSRDEFDSMEEKDPEEDKKFISKKEKVVVPFSVYPFTFPLNFQG